MGNRGPEKIFGSCDLGSIPARVRRIFFRLSGSRGLGLIPQRERVRFSDVVSLLSSVQETQVRFRVQSNCHVGDGARRRVGTTETQQVTDYADGRD